MCYRCYEDDPSNPDVAVERAAKGAIYLDEIAPGWAARVDLTRLDLTSSALCVLGQLYGGYNNAPLFDGCSPVTDLPAAAERVAKAAPLGFTRGGSSDDRNEPSWRDLNDAWEAEIRDRQDTP